MAEYEIQLRNLKKFQLLRVLAVPGQRASSRSGAGTPAGHATSPAASGSCSTARSRACTTRFRSCRTCRWRRCSSPRPCCPTGRMLTPEDLRIAAGLDELPDVELLDDDDQAHDDAAEPVSRMTRDGRTPSPPYPHAAASEAPPRARASLRARRPPVTRWQIRDGELLPGPTDWPGSCRCCAVCPLYGDEMVSATLVRDDGRRPGRPPQPVARLLDRARRRVAPQRCSSCSASSPTSTARPVRRANVPRGSHRSASAR